MMGSRLLAPALASLALAGCGAVAAVPEFSRQPTLTAVGSGLLADRVPVPAEPLPVAQYHPGNSIWQDNTADLFRDPRAARIGDVVTVKISIKDKASIDNNSKRSRDSKMNFKPELGYDIAIGGVSATGAGNIDASVDAGSTTDSKGGITRSESIELLVAAIVTGVLPNGNLIVSGSQEVRVNYEVRELSVAGIIRPRDIATDNTIAYDKIAEARISYGGRGRIMEVQQPGIAHQVWDVLTPF
jgi:flagellar L-ring protein precursor FlgH